MYYTGLDIHEATTQIQHMDQEGALGITMNIKTNTKELRAFLDRLDAPSSMVFEASRHYWWISQLLSSHPNVSAVKVVDPRRSRKIAEELSTLKGYGRAKNDRIDAEMLAEEDRRGLAPAINLPTARQLETRTVSRQRFELVHKKNIAASQLQAYLSMHGCRLSTQKLLKEDLSQLNDFEELPDYIQFVIHQCLAQIRLFSQQVEGCEEKLYELLPESDPQMKILRSVPGIGIVISWIILSEIFSISFFAKPQSLVSYSGLAPIENESDGKKGIIELNRHCNYFLKYAFVMAAHGARKHPKYRKKYEYDVKKHGKIRAKLNLARRIVKAVYWMLTRQQPFCY